MATISDIGRGFLDQYPVTTPPLNTSIALSPTPGSLLQGVSAPVVWAGAALIAIALAGTAFAPLIIALLAAAIWWQFLHTKG